MPIMITWWNGEAQKCEYGTLTKQLLVVETFNGFNILTFKVSFLIAFGCLLQSIDVQDSE